MLVALGAVNQDALPEPVTNLLGQLVLLTELLHAGSPRVQLLYQLDSPVHLLIQSPLVALGRLGVVRRHNGHVVAAEVYAGLAEVVREYEVGGFTRSATCLKREEHSYTNSGYR